MSELIRPTGLEIKQTPAVHTSPLIDSAGRIYLCMRVL